MQRLTRLDGLRGMLAVYVVLGHATPFVALPGWVAKPFSHGEAAVDLFFALSGLVIINSLERFKGRFWPFMKARAWRLLPVYFVVLGLMTVLLTFGSPVSRMNWLNRDLAAQQFWQAGLPQPLWAHLTVHLLLLQGLIPQGVLPYTWVTLLAPAWSLSTEWQFYVATAVLMPFLPKYRLESLALGLLGVGCAYHAMAPHLPDSWQFSRAFLADAAPYFALGIATAVWLRGGGIRLFVLCLIVSGVLGLFTPVPSKALIPLGWALAVLAQKDKGFPLFGVLLDSRAVQYLGAISYPLYLVNEPVQWAAAILVLPFAHGAPERFMILWLPCAVIGPILAAMALHHCLEKPLMKGWKTRVHQNTVAVVRS